MKTIGKPILIVLAVCSNIGMLMAQDSLLIKAIKANTYNLTIQNERLAGDGALVINSAIKESQFLLVGEQHGIKEVAQFTAALFTEAIPEEYKYLCIETDPHMASKLGELAAIGEPAMIDFSKKYPISIPFYDAKEEFHLLETVISLTKNTSSTLWGVDQVFMAAPRFLFSLLLDEAKTDEAKKVVSSYITRAQTGYAKFMETSDPQNMILNSLDESDFQKIHDAFGVDRSEKVKQILADIQTTKEIYELWATGKQYENNRVRAELMKKQFMHYYNEALKVDSLPKVVFKFGATHTFRGLSMYHQYDLGNLVSELAEMNGQQSAHFHVSGIKGMSQGLLGPPQDFDNSSNLNPYIKQVLEERQNDSWVLIDMRALRKELKFEDLEKIKDQVFGYDYWIYIPEAQPQSKL